MSETPQEVEAPGLAENDTHPDDGHQVTDQDIYQSLDDQLLDDPEEQS